MTDQITTKRQLKDLFPAEHQWMLAHMVFDEDEQKWIGFDEAGCELTFDKDPRVVADYMMEYAKFLEGAQRAAEESAEEDGIYDDVPDHEWSNLSRDPK